MNQSEHVIEKRHANGQVEYEEWRVDGKRHRLDGPAWVRYHDNGQVESEEWLVDGKRHRLDGPAYVEYHANGQVAGEYWYVNGLNHRLDGPARVWYHDNGQVAKFWYYEDQKVTPEFIQQKRLEQAPALAYIDGVKLVEDADQYYLIFGNEVIPTSLQDGIDRLEALGVVEYA